jgi:hypothetical protein
MPVREFLDTEAGWKSSGVFEAAFNGPNTRFLLIKPLALPSVAPHYVSYRSATDQLASLSDGGSARLADFTQTEDSRALVGLTSGDWQLLFITKGAEATHPRMHRSVVGSGVWAHVDGGGDAIAYKSAAMNEIRIGEFNHMRVATHALFDKELIDSDIEAIGATLTAQLLVDLGATHLHNFNQASAATAAQDLIGSANQTTISSGTIVVTDDDPPGWDFAVTVTPPLTFTLQMSGGVGNTDPAESYGGIMSTTSPGTDLFPDIEDAERISGLQRYRLVYVRNADVADGSVVAFVSKQFESGRELAVGWATEAAGVAVTKPANDHTAPSGVAFSAPSSVPAGLSGGTIAAGSFRGLWLRFTVNSNTPQDPTNRATYELEISRVS